MIEMTNRQAQIFHWVEVFIENNRFPPSRKEIAEAFKIMPNAIQDHLRAIEKKGFLTLHPGVPRGISINKG